RVLQHAEGPLVGIGDKGDAGVLQHTAPAVKVDAFLLGIGKSRVDHLASAGKRLEERLLPEPLPVFERPRAQETEDPPVAVKDSAVAVAVGARLALDLHGRARNLREASGDRELL